jgi:multidrug transporter EmrE-like cation transporter
VVYAGISKVVVFVLGYYLLEGKMTWQQLIFLTILVIGLVGLSLLGKGNE